MRRAAKTDGNHLEIMQALQHCGYSVQSLAAVGLGCPDLMVGRNGRVWLLEVKDPAQVPSKRKLTKDQKRWHAAWRGHVAVVETVEQALAAVGGGNAQNGR